MTTIEVTREDIDHGERRSCSNCPYALAVQRLCKEGVTVIVGIADVEFRIREFSRKYVLLSTEVRSWMRDYDWLGVALPFVSELDIPAAFLR